MNGQQLKNSILQLAIQGRLVPQDSKDEPASALLARIREEKKRLVEEKKIKKEKPLAPITDDEKRFDIPESWEWVRLGEIASIYGGKRIPVGSKLVDYNTGHIYIRVADMKDNTILTNDLKYVSDEIFKKIKQYIINKDDLYITVAGTIGKIGEVPATFDGANLTENADKIVFRYIKKRYLLFALLSEIVQNQIRQSTTKVGQPKLAIIRIQNLIIPLPPLAEQHRIVEKIEELLPLVEEYDEAQKKLDKLNDELPELLKKSVLQQAIMGKLDTRNDDDEPASVLLKRIKEEKAKLIKEKIIKKEKPLAPITDDEKPFDIPESWEWVRLGEIANLYIGKTPERSNPLFWNDGKYPWISISDMREYGFISSTKECISTNAASTCFKRISHVGSLIMSFKLTVGRTSILNVDAYHNEAIVTIERCCDDNNFIRDFLFYTLPILANMGDSKDAIKGKTLNSTSLNNLIIPLPPLAEQHRIVEKIEELLPLIDEMKKT